MIVALRPYGEAHHGDLPLVSTFDIFGRYSVFNFRLGCVFLPPPSPKSPQLYQHLPE